MSSILMRNGVCALALAAGIVLATAPAALSQRATLIKDPTTGNFELKAMTSKDLKAAITKAVETGELKTNEGAALIAKITDIETLMEQFDFIRDQQRRLVGSYGSVIH